MQNRLFFNLTQDLLRQFILASDCPTTRRFLFTARGLWKPDLLRKLLLRDFNITSALIDEVVLLNTDPKNSLQILFNIYTRLHNARANLHKANKLGLASCLKMPEKHRQILLCMSDKLMTEPELSQYFPESENNLWLELLISIGDKAESNNLVKAIYLRDYHNVRRNPPLNFQETYGGFAYKAQNLQVIAMLKALDAHLITDDALIAAGMKFIRKFGLTQKPQPAIGIFMLQHAKDLETVEYLINYHKINVEHIYKNAHSTIASSWFIEYLHTRLQKPLDEIFVKIKVEQSAHLHLLVKAIDSNAKNVTNYLINKLPNTTRTWWIIRAAIYAGNVDAFHKICQKFKIELDAETFKHALYSGHSEIIAAHRNKHGKYPSLDAPTSSGEISCGSFKLYKLFFNDLVINDSGYIINAFFKGALPIAKDMARKYLLWILNTETQAPEKAADIKFQLKLTFGNTFILEIFIHAALDILFDRGTSDFFKSKLLLKLSNFLKKENILGQHEFMIGLALQDAIKRAEKIKKPILAAQIQDLYDLIDKPKVSEAKRLRR